MADSEPAADARAAGILPATVLEAGLWLLVGFVVLFMALVIVLTVFFLGMAAGGDL